MNEKTQHAHCTDKFQCFLFLITQLYIYKGLLLQTESEASPEHSGHPLVAAWSKWVINHVSRRSTSQNSTYQSRTEQFLSFYILKNGVYFCHFTHSHTHTPTYLHHWGTQVAEEAIEGIRPVVHSHFHLQTRQFLSFWEYLEKYKTRS